MSKNTLPTWLSNLVVAALAVGVVWLIWSLAAENRELKARIAAMSQPDPAESLVAGDPLPDVTLEGPDGEGSSAALAGDGAVMVFLTTTCPYCERTLPIWSALRDRLQERGVPFVAVSLDPAALTRQYATAHELDWPVWTLVDPEAAADLQVNTVPYTVVVGPDGEVSETWLGALFEEVLERIEEAVESEIPGAIRGPTGSRDETPGCCEAPTSSTDVGS